MAGRAPASAPAVSPALRSALFVLNLLGWVVSLGLVAVGLYARLLKQAEAAVACLALDPALLLLLLGVLVFLVTFCGCVGALRENICLLQAFSICLTVIFLLQLAAGALGFVFSDGARGRVSEVINAAIVHYRDDPDLQNLIDFGQKEFRCCGGVSYRDWSRNVYFNCSAANPSRERCSVPFSCCLHDPGKGVINTMCGQGAQARSYAEASASIHPSGCIAELAGWLHRNLVLLGGIALALALPQLVGIVLARVLLRQVKDQVQRHHRAEPWR
ncbi:tetraspanin-33 [Cygnus olor]|uniref:tetraspanin-33 n=1 Tax=Cygnus olor TaxID=8869 RepID=UPI001ADE8D5E|nr:tetraspanin-33 [Cygnus olor]